MSWNLYCMELRQNISSFLIWCFSLCGLLIIGFAFYPMLTQNDFVSQMDVLFRNPMMKNIMSAFNVDLNQLTKLGSFFTTYASIYIVLIGCIFSISTASRIISKEELLKTADFLYTRPLTRFSIFVSKLLAYVTLLVILNMAMLGSGILGMELFKTPGSLMVYVTDDTKNELTAAFREKPELFRETFTITDRGYADPTEYITAFEKEPMALLTAFKNEQALFAEKLAVFGLAASIVKKIFIYYPLKNFLIHFVYIFLLMLSFGAIGLALSVLVRGSTAGAAIGITLGFYFLNSLSNISPRVDKIGYLSPFKYVNNDILNPAYTFDWWRILFFVCVSVLLFTVALFVFRKKDVLV